MSDPSMKIEGLLKSVGYLGNGVMSLNPGKCESICKWHNVRAIVSNGVSFEKYEKPMEESACFCVSTTGSGKTLLGRSWPDRGL